VKAKALAQAHSERGQSRFCQLMLWAKHAPRVNPDALLLALTISAGQFVESHTEHARTVLGAVRELGLSAKAWWTGPVQNVLHRRKLAQTPKSYSYRGEKLQFGPEIPSEHTKPDVSWGDPRVKWAGWRYQDALGITEKEAHYFNLTDIVNTKLSRAVIKARKPKRTKEELRAQTKNATQFRVDRADKLAGIAQDMHGNGCSILTIASHLNRSTRTVYEYLHRFVRFRWQNRITTDIPASLWAIDTCLPTAGNKIHWANPAQHILPPVKYEKLLI